MYISCIIPTKDRCDMTVRAIESILEQEVAVNEIVVVDDGSTDSTKEVVTHRFQAVNYLQTEGKGPGAARNFGAAHAKGDVFMFLDSDDRWLSNHTKALAALIKKGHAVSYGLTLNKNEITGETFYIPESTTIPFTGSTFRNLLRWCFLVPSSVAMTRDAFFEAKGFPERKFGEDWYFFLKLADISRFEDFGFTNEVITHRTLHKGSLSHTCGHGDAILSLLMDIKAFAARTEKTLQEDIAYLNQAISLAKREHSTWNTVQDWFCAMKRLQNPS
ncbi:MAG: glycosyltransferase family 2 protein [Dissulfuribacterales bacterium]